MPTNPQSDFGLRVRVLREQRQWTLEELAKRAGMDWSQLGLIERGKRNVTLRTIAKLAAGLGVSMKALFES